MIEDLYEKYRAELIRWCRRMTQNESAAEDLVQEAFTAHCIIRRIWTAWILRREEPGSTGRSEICLWTGSGVSAGRR